MSTDGSASARTRLSRGSRLARLSAAAGKGLLTARRAQRRGDLDAVGISQDEIADVVLETLAADADEAGATALQGRIDPYLYPSVRDDRYRLHPTAWSLVHARDPAVLGAVLGGQALLTRMDGEWWMGHHRLDTAASTG